MKSFFDAATKSKTKKITDVVNYLADHEKIRLSLSNSPLAKLAEIKKNTIDVLNRYEESTEKIELKQLIDNRYKDFFEALANAEKSHTQDSILSQLERFSDVLTHILNKHKLTIDSKTYFQRNYYPVGAEVNEEGNPNMQISSYISLGVGVALLVASIPCFILIPVAGICLVSTGICFLLAATTMHFGAKNILDISRLQEEEKALFKIASELKKQNVEPENEVEEESNDRSMVSLYGFGQ